MAPLERTLSEWYWLLPVLLAPFVGSFLGLVIQRLPAGEGVVWGRSACPHCGRALAVRDLVPLLSWLWNRRKCRFCAAKLGWFYPGVELAALLVALWAATVLTGWLLWATCFLGWLLLTLAWIDQRHMVLPDILSLPLIPSGLYIAYLAVPERLLDHLAGAVLGFAVLFGLDLAYRHLRGRQGLGLGDAKLLSGIGAWVAWQGLASVVLVAAITGLGLAVSRGLGSQPLNRLEKLPFAPHLCFGAWLVWLYGPLTLAR